MEKLFDELVSKVTLMMTALNDYEEYEAAENWVSENKEFYTPDILNQFSDIIDNSRKAAFEAAAKRQKEVCKKEIKELSEVINRLIK